ncbi:co-regulatory protein PtrA N-terminal domain-containing protein [Pseudomonas sp. R5(2019)]|uniref:co-regulatory protein PtrA N-terminal domain-containing protein n=1 Tax=Pseudomonas sp. R5(2019) TaxID=2697566 RepID=UPI0014130CE3|nr:co-regulatory protein PtrA N-terminal domain-containing protein [Pseudomonas sp. R5(2019)]
MKTIKLLVISVLLLGSTAAMAEGGAERSQEFWKQFKLSQEKTHGDKGQPVAENDQVKK